MTTLGTYYYLAVGDTLSSNLPSSGDYLDLMDASNYLIVQNGLKFTEAREADPLAPKVKYQLDQYAKFELHVKVFGSSADNLQANIRALDLKLRQARLAQGAQPQGTGVCLWQREQNMTQFVFWDVVDGQVTAITSQGAALVRDIILTLDVLPFAHGTAVVGTATGTITNGTASVLYVSGITGDVPALGQLTITDVSTNGVVINGVTTGARSQPTGSMLTTDNTPIQALTPASPGAAHTDATAIGGSAARVTASAAWQTLATAVQPSGAKQTGLFDVFLRLKDAATVLGKPGAPTVVSSTTGGSLAEGVYQYVLTSYDGSGNESPITPSAFGTVNLTMPANSWFNGAESGDLAGGWDAIQYIGTGNAAQGSVSVGTGSAYPQALGSAYGYHAIAANGGGAVMSKAITSAAGTGAIRYWMRINTDSGAASTTVYTQIPIVTSSGGGTVASLYNCGAGWTVGIGTSGSQLANSHIILPEGDWIRVEAVATWTGSTVGITVYINDSAAGSSGTPGLAGGATPTYMGIGALTFGAGTSLSIDFDNVQVSNARINANTGSSAVSWTAGTNQSGYYLYWNKNGGTWYRIDVGNVTSYTHTSNNTGTIQNPPSAIPAVVPTSFKLQVAANTGSATPTYYDGPVMQAAIAGGAWEEVYAGALNLPPITTTDGGTPAPYIVRVQVQNTGTTFTTFDADSFRVRPHKELPQISARVPTLDMATKRKWVIGTNRYGFPFGQLQNTGTSAVEGTVAPVGALLLGPGDTKIDIQPVVAGGKSDVVDCKFTAQLTYTPRFRYQRGNA